MEWKYLQNKTDFYDGISYWFHNYKIYGGFEEKDRCYFGKLEQIERSLIAPEFDIAYLVLSNGAVITELLTEFICKYDHILDVGKMIDK
jgi:hypothetical protein